MTLVQLTAGGKSGAANLQMLMTAIDRAASVGPEPDLLVLPGGCDFGGHRVTAEVSGRFATFSETVAWKARDWGLYIAIGLHVSGAQKTRPAGFLYDPDGDVAVCTRGVSSDARPEKHHAASWMPSPIGWLGVADPASPSMKSMEDTFPREGGFLACSLLSPRQGTNGVVLPDRHGRTAGIHRVYWGTAGWARRANKRHEEGLTQTKVFDPDANVMQYATGDAEAFVQVEIDLQPAPQGAAVRFGPSDRSAD